MFFVEFASINFREIKVTKTAKDLNSNGVAVVDIKSMLLAIAQKEKELCQQGTTFGPWSGCTKPCGGGMRYRYRDSVLCIRMHQRARPGVLKKSFEQHQRCNIKQCAAGHGKGTVSTSGSLPSLEQPP